jgi:hypothetical protein
MHYFRATECTIESFKPMLQGGLMDTWEQYYTNKKTVVINNTVLMRCEVHSNENHGYCFGRQIPTFWRSCIHGSHELILDGSHLSAKCCLVMMSLNPCFQL